MHALKATFQIARIFQACSLIAIIGLTANFIAEIVSINAKPPNVLIGTITVTSVAAIYCILTLVILLDNILPLLICAITDTLVLAALIVVTVVIGRPFSYLQCTGIPSLLRRDDPSAYTFATKLTEYLDNLNVDGNVDYGTWIGVSREVSLEVKAIWGHHSRRPSVTANAVYNTSVSDETFFPDATFDYCNVTLAYSHAGKDDQVLLQIWLPAPEKFQNRWLSTGGGGFAINGQGSSLPGGIIYGAAAGQTDGGFGGFSNQLDSQTPLANGTANLDAIYMFGYQAIHELGIIGKAFTRNFFSVADNSKVYAYYQGCSEGGRDGWSQAQRFDDLDGLIIGAPAMRYGQQQANHLYADVVEKTMDYYPPTCELEKIMNLTISACDALDGKKDGVVSRTDLCKLNFNINTTIGHPYSCAASTSSMQLRKRVGMTSTTPAQNGTVTRQGAAVAAKMLEGLHDSQGRRAYIWYQPSASFDDAQTKYNSETDSWELSITSLGGEWVTRFLELNTADNLSSLDNVTYDTLRDWMQLGWDRYADVLQTTNPDLTNFQKSGGKILHFHGESDPSIPAGSSVHYHESVRDVMYPGLSYSDSTDALADWYRLYLVPGAAHCSPSTSQPNGPFPQTNLAVMIDWVENGKTPSTLNATVLDGANKGQKGEICAWPLRPVWEGEDMKCVYHQESIDTWKYEFDAYKVPLY